MSKVLSTKRILADSDITSSTIPVSAFPLQFSKVDTLIQDGDHCSKGPITLNVFGTNKHPWVDRPRRDLKHHPLVDVPFGPANVIPLRTSKTIKKTVHQWLFPNNLTVSGRKWHEQIKEHCFTPTLRGLNLHSPMHNASFNSHGFGVYTALHPDIFYAAVTMAMSMSMVDLHCMRVSVVQFQEILQKHHHILVRLNNNRPRLLSSWTITAPHRQRPPSCNIDLCSTCGLLFRVPLIPDMPTCFPWASRPFSTSVHQLGVSEHTIKRPTTRLLNSLFQRRKQIQNNNANKEELQKIYVLINFILSM